MTPTSLMEKIVMLCKRRGFIFQGSELYGGLNGTWDYGPLGVELRRNIKESWWRSMTRLRDDIVGLDGAILMNRLIWKASGHEEGFSDPMVDCKTCKSRFRADQIDSTTCPMKPSKTVATCGGELSEPRSFNLLFKTHVGPVEDTSNIAYLRGETCQAIYVQFKNVLETSRKKLPFGIAQIGKAFRNEINPRNFIFRSREFEQMEMEFFVKPDTGFQWLEYWLEERLKWHESIGLPRSKIHVLDVPEKDRAFYSKKTYDLEYEFPFGIQELEGIAYRGDHDLKQHQEHSGKSLEYFDEETQTHYLPHVVEPAVGVDRVLLALLCEAYDEENIVDEETGKSETRTVLRFVPKMAPIKVGVFPLLKNKPQLVAKAKEVANLLRPHFTIFYDDAGAIGRRYRRQDEIGTPFGVTIDFETLEGVKEGTLKGEIETVTLRYRDSMKQERMRISELLPKLLSELAV